MNSSGDRFSSKIGFVLAAAGSAVGIGNLVGFPVAATKNGGGAFLLLYLFFVVAICLPLMLAELALGRATRSNPLGAYTQASGGSVVWRAAGALSLITPFMIAVFYTVITVWLLGYLAIVLGGGLASLADPAYFGEFINGASVFLFLALVIGLVVLVLKAGVQDGIERASRTLMPVLFVMLLGLAAFVLTLPNALQGLKFYLTPDFSRLNLQVVNGALSQAFFSLSLGMGILVTYGSYMRERENLQTSASWVAGTDTAVALTAGLMTIPAIFAIYPDTNPQTLSDSTVGLIFSFFPKIFMALVPTTGYLLASALAFVFFSLAFIAAITSLVSIIEVPVSALKNETRSNRPTSVLLVVGAVASGAVLCALSFGQTAALTEFVQYGGQTKSLFDLLVDVFYETILPLNGLLICLLVVWRWKRANLTQQLQIGSQPTQSQESTSPPGPGSNSFLARYTHHALAWWIPAILGLVFTLTVYNKFLAA